jgi:outer membrane protein assembly factor BamC
MTTSSPLRSFRPTPIRAATLALALLLGSGLEGCTMVGDWLGGKSDYQAGAKRTQPLDVPPDLTQLQRDSRYLPQGGVVNASELGKPGASPAASDAPAVAVNTLGDLRVERSGEHRYLVSARSPEVLWPAIRQFWIDRGFKITDENATAGYLETDWIENKAKRPHGFIQDALGKVVDGMFDSGFRDRYRVRLERPAGGGTEIYLTHFGLEEVVTGWQKDNTQWVARPNDPGLEAEMLSTLMVSLGAGADSARTAVASAAPASGAVAAATGSSRARLVTGQPAATVQVDDGFDRAWRRVGLALDHGGFTVEDRDRAQGLYFVRFVDAKEASKDEPGIFSKVFSWFGKDEKSPVGKYRIQIKGESNRSTISILNNQGQPDNSDNAKRIVALLVDELK